MFNKKVLTTLTPPHIEEIIEEVTEATSGMLTFSSTKSFTLNVYDNTKHWNGILEYSTDKETWNTWDGTKIRSGKNNAAIFIRGIGNNVITGDYNNEYRWVLSPVGSNKIKCIGNIETLLDYQTVLNGEHPVMSSYCYAKMFYGCTSLTQAPELPATVLADRCYASMFSGCTSLVQAPELPATTLVDYCYENMFCYCTSLTQAPELPATTLAELCYADMFYGCESLIQAPELPATNLAFLCYYGMFIGCTSLTQAPELPATTLAFGCYQVMFYGCESLIQAPELPATNLVDTCYQSMFSGCTALVQIPKLPATTLTEESYNEMFNGCTSLKFSTTQTEECPNEYRIPSVGTCTTTSGVLSNMFSNTSGTFTGTPQINTTYYTNATIV